MEATAPQSLPPKPRLLDRALSFFILLLAWTALGSAADHFNFLGVHQSLRSELLTGALWAALMVIFVPGFAQPGMHLRRAFRSR
jgi:hypothetical protein